MTEPQRASMVEVRPARVGWKARPAFDRTSDDGRNDRSHWRPTRHWAARAAARPWRSLRLRRPGRDVAA